MCSLLHVPRSAPSSNISAEENRQTLLRRVIAEARAAPIPDVHATQVRSVAQLSLGGTAELGWHR